MVTRMLNELAIYRTELGFAHVAGSAGIDRVERGFVVSFAGRLLNILTLRGLLLGLLLCVLILLVLLTGDASY